MSILSLRAATADGDAAPVHRLGWRRALLLHLGPAAAAFAAALALAPLMSWLGLPPSFALTVAFALVLTPVELGLLLRAAHRETGRWSLRSLPSVIAYRRPLRWWALLIPPLFALALGIAVILAPAGNEVGGWLAGVYPHWMLPGYDQTKGYSAAILVPVLLATLAVDGIVNPVVEELYFRGYLLPRLPVTGWPAVVTSAALFSAQHYWQPYNWALIFVLQLIATTLIVRLRSIRLGIAMHVLTNSFGILAVLVAVLA